MKNKNTTSSETTRLAKFDAQAQQALATIDTMTQAIAQVTDFKGAKVAISTSKAFQLYVKEYKLGREALLRGAEAQLRAQLQAGTVAKNEAKNPDYAHMVAEARLGVGQVNRWRRIAGRIPLAEVSRYVQSVRENTEDELPSVRGLLCFVITGKHEENNKDPRTELTKQFCHFHPFVQAQADVDGWLSDLGRSKEEKEQIKTMWKKIVAEGRLFEGQTAGVGEGEEE